MRVLWFERRGADFLPPPTIPRCRSPASRRTICRRWRAGGWAPTSPSASASGSSASTTRKPELAERASEKRALKAALVGLGLVGEEADLTAPMSDEFAAAVHAFLAGAGSLLASAQLDDLSGERTAANLPGTDRERPNWRHRHVLDVETLFAAPRAREILAALAARRG